MRKLEDYLALPYTTILRRDEDGDIVARIDELAGCAAHGQTAEKALENLEEVKRLWITDCLDRGDQVPEPADEKGLPSGKWVQRVPRSLHSKLVKLAAREKVSLNQLVTSILAEAVGARKALQPAEALGYLKQATAYLKQAALSGSTSPILESIPRNDMEYTAIRKWVLHHGPMASHPGAIEIFRKRLPDEVKIKKTEYGNEEKIDVHQH